MLAISTWRALAGRGAMVQSVAWAVGSPAVWAVAVERIGLGPYEIPPIRAQMLYVLGGYAVHEVP